MSGLEAERKDARDKRMPWREQLSDEEYFATRGALPGGVVEPETVASFRRVIGPLETKQGRLLHGYGWRVCLRAYIKNPDRVERLAGAINRKPEVHSPLGVLIRSIEHGEAT